MAIDPSTGQSVVSAPSFDQRFAGFLDPSTMGGLMADQGQLGMQSQLAQSMMNAGYIPRTGFGGALAQMVQAAVGAHMLKNAQAQQAQLYQQQLDAINKAAQAKHAQDQADLDAASKRAIAQATGINEGEIQNKLKYAPQTSAADAQAAAAKEAAIAPIDVQKAIATAKGTLPLEIQKAYATAGAGESAKASQLQKIMAMPDSAEKQAQLTLLLGQNAPMLGMMGGGAQGGAQVNGPDFLKTLNPTTAQQVKALAEGRMQFPSGFALKSPYWQTMLQAVSQYDPSFDAVNYNARAKTRSDFTSGKAAQTINALNTVAGHLGDLSDAAQKLNNFGGVLTPLNSVKNFAESTMGDPNIKEFEANRKAAVDELTRVYRGSGGSEQDIKTWSDALNSAGSPAQLQGTIGKISELLNSKISALGDQYKQGMGTAGDQGAFISKKAQAALAKIAQRSGEVPAGPTSQLSDEDLLKKYGGQ